jgi:hypothetical protein
MRYLVLSSLLSFAILAADPPSVVSNVNVTSDKVEDVSSLEAWKKAFIKDGMSDKEKALAVFKSVAMFRHQDVPSREYVPHEETPFDPIKTFNVYGYNMCSGASAAIIQLARAAGLKARGWAIQNHSVPEVFFDGKWHLLDASLLVYFPQPNGDIAGVEEISQAIDEWYVQNPSFKGNDAKLREFMRGNGWKKGPAILTHTTAYDSNGWLPAATHGWYSTMQEYENKSKHFLYEYGAALGYRVNIQLRPGEKWIRNWSNKGLHVNLLENGPLGCLNKAPGQDDLRYSPALGDLAPGRVGNGQHIFRALASRDLSTAIDGMNIRPGEVTGTRSPVIATLNTAEPGYITYRLPSSYVYLDGTLQFTNMHANREVKVEFSRNHGRDWKVIATSKTEETVTIDLKPFIHRLYDYQIRFSLAPMSSIENVVFIHDIQHSQRALPALAQGKNTITFSTGANEGTYTLEGALHPDRKEKNLVYTEFAPQLENFSGSPLFMTGGTGSVTFPVKVTGDLKRLRIGLHYRARDKADSLEIQASYDGGKTFKTFGLAEGPTPGYSTVYSTSEIPPETRDALVRFSGKQRTTTGILDWRIDADYAERYGGFRPVKITYVWTENGEEKKHVHIAKQPNETYTIDCATKPVMVSYTVELAE